MDETSSKTSKKHHIVYIGKAYRKNQRVRYRAFLRQKMKEAQKPFIIKTEQKELVFNVTKS